MILPPGRAKLSTNPSPTGSEVLPSQSELFSSRSGLRELIGSVRQQSRLHVDLQVRSQGREADRTAPPHSKRRNRCPFLPRIRVHSSRASIRGQYRAHELVRLTRQPSGAVSTVVLGPLKAKLPLPQQAIETSVDPIPIPLAPRRSVDHSVRPDKNRSRNGQSHGPGSLCINDEFERCRLLDR